MKKLNNKGFSVVELIIVIAIMAILVGVVGAQVIPYLEKSRVSKDLQVLSAWNTAAVSAYSIEAGNINASATYEITVGTSSTTISPASDKLLKTFAELAGFTWNDASNSCGGYAFSSELSSKAGQALSTVSIKINGTTGEITTTAAGFDPIENK